MDNLGAIASRWADLLAESSALKSWCDEKYGKEPHVYLGLNLKAPPGEDECPVVIVLPVSTTLTDESWPNDAVISVMWSVKNSETEEQDNGVFILTGLLESEEFGREIWDVLYQDKTVIPQTIQFEVDPAGSFPQFPGSMEITVKYK